MAAPAADARVELLGLDRAELAAALVASGLVAEKAAKMRANQLWHWIYYRGSSDFAEMTTLAKELHKQLGKAISVGRWNASRVRKRRNRKSSVEGNRVYVGR